MEYKTIRGFCDICGEPIDLEDEHYVMPYGELVCVNCIDDWVAQYRRLGEVDLGFDVG